MLEIVHCLLVSNYKVIMLRIFIIISKN